MPSYPTAYKMIFALLIAAPNTSLAVLDLHLFSDNPCGDGSPSGIYSSPERDVEGMDHVIVFQGGGMCFRGEDCLDAMQKTPNKFSSQDYPVNIKGEMILSENALENVGNLEKAAKWFVPYCTQDGYLGTGIYEGGGLKRTGSLQFMQVLRHWASLAIKPRKLVVVGISIGAMGVLNHFDELQATATAAGVEKTQIILDSGILSSNDISLETDATLYLRRLTSHATHPMCYEKDMNMYIDSESSLDDLLPCCLSLTCMLAQKNNKMGKGTSILLINSLYDPLELSYILSPANEDDELMESDYRPTSEITTVSEKLGLKVDALWKAGEAGGKRKHIIEQGVHQARNKNQLNESNEMLTWLSTSCVMHTFFDPAPELERLFRCIDNSAPTNQAEIGDTVCKNGVIGIMFAKFHELHMTLLGPTQRWEIATSNGIPLRSLVNKWIESPGLGPIIQDTCHGPNCVDVHRHTGPNQCMDLIEIEDLNKPIPFLLQCLGMALFAILSVLGIIVRFRKVVKINLLNSQKKSSSNGDDSITIGPLSIYIKPPKSKCSPCILNSKNTDESNSQSKISKLSLPLIDRLSFTLPRGAITALTGRSGSGKSTLVSAMMQQANKNLEVYSKQNLVHDYKVVYLRQNASCQGMSHITAEQLLQSNAVLYNATTRRLQMLIEFIEHFKGTPCGMLSGGQIRRLEICSSLLLTPDILILDEPLSGLDSVNIGYVLDMLKKAAFQDNIAILVTIHQPSTDALLNHFTKLMTLENGKFVCNATIAKLWGNENACHKSHAEEEVHQLLQGNSNCRLRGIVEEKEQSNTNTQPDINKKYLSARKAVSNASLQQQCIAIAQRLHMEHGISVADIIRLPAVMSLLAFVLKFDGESLTQLLFAVTCFIAVPVNVMRYLISEHCKCWVMHRNDILDRRISVISFILGTQPYQYAIHIVMMLISLALAYAILGWKFNTLVVQFLFSAIYLLVSSQLGRVLGTYFDGNYSKFSRVYSLIIILTFLFGGTVVNVRKLPLWTPWIISHNFWATSGAMLEHLHFGNGFGQQPCTSLISCLLSNPNVVAVSRGYSPITTTFRSFYIITSVFLLLCVAEVIVTRLQVSRFANMNTSIPPRQERHQVQQRWAMSLQPSLSFTTHQKRLEISSRLSTTHIEESKKEIEMVFMKVVAQTNAEDNIE